MSSGCHSCQKPKAQLECGICKEAICKSCTQFLEEGAFSFLATVPENLRHQTYCPACFQEHVAPAWADYHSLMDKARETLVYFKSQSKETRLVNRTEKTVFVKDCPDHDELILRLAFVAAQANFNSVIDVVVEPEKVKVDGYQTTIWSGSGIPANVHPKNLVKDRSIWQNPN